MAPDLGHDIGVVAQVDGQAVARVTMIAFGASSKLPLQLVFTEPPYRPACPFPPMCVYQGCRWTIASLQRTLSGTPYSPIVPVGQRSPQRYFVAPGTRCRRIHRATSPCTRS